MFGWFKKTNMVVKSRPRSWAHNTSLTISAGHDNRARARILMNAALKDATLSGEAYGRNVELVRSILDEYAVQDARKNGTSDPALSVQLIVDDIRELETQAELVLKEIRRVRTLRSQTGNTKEHARGDANVYMRAPIHPEKAMG